MDYSKTEDKIKTLYWMALLLAFYGETQFLLRRKGLSLYKSVILLTDSFEQSREIIAFLQDTVDAVEIRNFKKPVFNYLLNLHRYSRKEKEDEVIDFLTSEGGFCVEVFAGIVPNYMSGQANIIEVPQINDNEDMKKRIRTEIDAFRNFVRENPQRTLEVLGLFQSSKDKLELEGGSRFLLSMTSVLKLYEAECRKSAHECETEDYLRSAKEQILIWTKQMESYDSDDAQTDVIRNVIFRYLEYHPEILIGDINRVEGSLYQALERGQAILYDKDFYFVMEDLFRIICQDLLETMSFLKIKKVLAEADIIQNNQLEINGFTVKRVITNAFGYSQRLRFLKIDKVFLQTESGLYLEELRGD